MFLEDRDSLATRLAQSVYLTPAIVPPSPWMNVPPQGETGLTLVRGQNGVWTARLTPAATERPHWWLVQTRNGDNNWRSTLMPGSLREIRVPASADRIAVRALDRAAVEGPVTVLMLK